MCVFTNLATCKVIFSIHLFCKFCCQKIIIKDLSLGSWRICFCPGFFLFCHYYAHFFIICLMISAPVEARDLKWIFKSAISLTNDFTTLLTFSITYNTILSLPPLEDLIKPQLPCFRSPFKPHLTIQTRHLKLYLNYI